MSPGYYADPEAECQVFHICAADAFGGLSKYSFLCPNGKFVRRSHLYFYSQVCSSRVFGIIFILLTSLGTIFNQNYFICDWWFNFDCAEAENLYSKNDEIAAEREANTGAGGLADDQPIYASDVGASAPAGDYGAAAAPVDDYALPPGTDEALLQQLQQ